MLQGILNLWHLFIGDLGGISARFTMYYAISDFDRRLMQMIYTLAKLVWDIFGLPMDYE